MSRELLLVRGYLKLIARIPWGYFYRLTTKLSTGAGPAIDVPRSRCLLSTISSLVGSYYPAHELGLDSLLVV